MTAARFNAVENASYARLWYEAIGAKHHNRGRLWQREDFDQLLGDCSAVTDVPCALSALELIQAYPEAKVILNKREFVAWHNSALAALEQVLKSWFFFYFMHLGRDLLWVYRLWFNLHDILFYGDMRKNGRIAYDEHYALVRGAMVGREKESLEWELADGFGPFCKFLNVDEPKEEFPSGNTSVEFDKRIQRNTVKRFRRAMKNTVGLLSLGVFAMLWGAGVVAPLQWKIWGRFTQQ